jgi:hypothetical protein
MTRSKKRPVNDGSSSLQAYVEEDDLALEKLHKDDDDDDFDSIMNAPIFSPAVPSRVEQASIEVSVDIAQTQSNPIRDDHLHVESDEVNERGTLL